MRRIPQNRVFEPERFGALIRGLVLCSFCASTAAWADSIELINTNRYDNVQILSAKYDSLSYKLEKAPAATTITGDKVFAIFRESQLLQGARTALEAGDTAKALKDLTAVVAAAKEGTWEKAEAGYLVGKAHLVAHDVKEAEKAFKAYIEKHKAEKDWYLPFATSALAESLLEAKQPGTAELQFKDLAQYGGQWAAQAKLGEAKAILAQRGAAAAQQARSLCDEVAKSREAPASLKNLAVVIRGRILLLQKNPQQAVKELTDAFFSAGKQDLDYSAERAEATLLMGRACVALGGKENQEQAEIWLLRVPALYRRYATVYADACDDLSSLYELLGNATRATEWKKRRENHRAASAPAPQAAPAAPPPTGPAAPAKKASGGAAGGRK